MPHTPYELLQFIVLSVVLIAPLIPMRRRSAGIAHFPTVTVALLAANVICYLASLSGGSPDQDEMRKWGMIPRDVSIVTLVTHLFLHGHWFHLLFNMVVFWFVGPHVEEALGHLEYLLFYIGCGIAAGLLHLVLAMLLMPAAIDTPLVGASGAIFGLLGLFVVRYWRAKVLLFSVPATVAISFFVALQLFSGIATLSTPGGTGSTAHWAHIGGFFFGALLAFPLRMREESRREYSKEDAEKAVAEGDNEVAAAHYRQMLSNAPEDAETHFALARVYMNLRQSEAAHRHLKESLHFFLKSNQSLAVARVYQDALRNFEVFPIPGYMLQRIANACEETEHFTLAVHALSDLCRDYPDTQEAEVALLRLGRIHLEKMGQPQNAEAIFSEFLRLYPNSEWKNNAIKLRDEARRSNGLGTLPAPGL